ncbi:MAG: molecular chaperone DnaJ [Proteobacteria bacterium]|nr:molecular chaperone DnaJ [Pseudomonadota bacterium]
MIYLLPALAVVFAVMVWLGRRTREGRGDWRVASGLLATACSVGAVVTGAHGSWLVSALLVAAAGWFGFDVRRRGAPEAKAQARPDARRMSDAEARSILGVGAGASAEEVQAAYVRLMRSVHPDAGGTSGLAAQLNAARDRLLGKA